MRDVLEEVQRWLESGEHVAIATVIQTWGSAPRPAGSAMALTAGGKITGSVSGGCVEGAVVESGFRCLSTGRPQRLRFGVSDEAPGSVGPACGVAIARTLGYRTVVVDPREAFASAERFPDVDRLVSAWPDRALGEIGIDASTAVAVLTHDPKLDDPALAAALRSPAFYVGALGSRKTQEKRRQRLLGAGLDEEALARLHAPIGLPIGGRPPGENAPSIMAHIVPGPD